MIGLHHLGLALALASAPAPGRPLVVGVKDLPPFVVHQPDGRWSGTGVEVWVEVADMLDVDYEFVERDLDGLFRGLQDGSLDVAVSALTVTAERERIVDFTHPFDTTGLGLAVAHKPPETWFDLFLLVFDEAFLRLVLTFASLQLIVGALMWLLERRRNPHLQGTAVRGVGSGLWWAVVTMATVGYGDKVPITAPGRLLAMLWMLASLIILTSVTASITTSLTLGQIESKVSGPEDLGKLRLGTVAGTTSEEDLRDLRLNYRRFPDPRAGLAAIAADELDGVVYDQPMLAAMIAGEFAGRLDLLPRSFQRQDYAFALPAGSPLREPINRALAERLAEPSR
jgi:polar amino acid transport system substrate-binding protein